MTDVPRPQPAVDRSGPVSYWLRGDAPACGSRRSVATASPTSSSSAPGSPGLWTALALTDTDPGLRVVVLEAETVAFGASGRNGGFCEASLTHGLANGIRHFPDELERLEREGLANLQGLIAFTREHGIDCDLEETGTLTVADRPHQVDELRAWVDEAAEHGEDAGVHGPGRDPGRGPLPALAGRAPTGRPAATSCSTRSELCRGLARVARERGVRDPRALPRSSASSASPAGSSSP